MNFSEALNPNLIKVWIESTNKQDALEEMAQFMAEKYPFLEKNLILNSILEREKQMSTGIITNFAIPHCRVHGVEGSFVCAGISKNGIDYGSLDSEPVYFILMMAVSSKGSDTHLSLLKNISLLADDDDFLDEILELETSDEVYDAIVKYEKKIQGEEQ
mgnify:CR=1 FL=1